MPTPADLYAELFTAVQGDGVFDDSKTFVDCVPHREPALVLAEYRAQRDRPGFNLSAFVHASFEVPRHDPSDYVSMPGQPLPQHIDDLWPVLTRHPSEHVRGSSLLALSHPYVVPGGRFTELYYWDSYFTMLGLAESGLPQLVHAMTRNFADLIDAYGHVPNGTRSYYLSRSQPPVFALMVALCEARGGEPARNFLPQLKREHAFWMAGAESLAPGDAHRRVVRLEDGAILNRYWDERDTPREEAWREDVATARESARAHAAVWRDLRAAAESGWDFSSRWLREPEAPDDDAATGLAGIRTTAILPVDLNAFLYRLEMSLAALSAQTGETAEERRYAKAAEARRTAVIERMWDPSQGAFFDWDWQLRRRRRCLTAACAVPLFTGLADVDQADATARTIVDRLLRPGGLATTECTSGQQWDAPNGWAPLQWIAIKGLANTGHRALARAIAHRWLDTVASHYRSEAKLAEKYALRLEADGGACRGGHGGEYPLQDGFGWTNGVTRRLLHETPRHAARVAAARARHTVKP